MGHHDCGFTAVKLCGKSENNIVDKRRCVPVLGFLVRPGAKEAQSPPVKPRNRHDLYRTFFCPDGFNLRCGVDMEVTLVFGDLPEHLKGPGVIVVLCPEQEDY